MICRPPKECYWLRWKEFCIIHFRCLVLVGILHLYQHLYVLYIESSTEQLQNDRFSTWNQLQTFNLLNLSWKNWNRKNREKYLTTCQSIVQWLVKTAVNPKWLTQYYQISSINLITSWTLHFKSILRVNRESLCPNVYNPNIMNIKSHLCLNRSCPHL